MLAQILDRGDLAAWQALYALAAADPALRRRILALVRRVPLPYPAFWLAALASLGDAVDSDDPVARRCGHRLRRRLPQAHAEPSAFGCWLKPIAERDASGR